MNNYVQNLLALLQKQGLQFNTTSVEMIETGRGLTYQEYPVEKIIRAITVTENDVIKLWLEDEEFSKIATHWLRLTRRQQEAKNATPEKTGLASLICRKRIAFMVWDRKYYQFCNLIKKIEQEIVQHGEHSSDVEIFRLPHPNIIKSLELGIDPAFSTLKLFHDNLIKMSAGIPLGDKYKTHELSRAVELEEYFELKYPQGKVKRKNEKKFIYNGKLIPAGDFNLFQSSTKTTSASSLQSLPIPVSLGLVKYVAEMSDDDLKKLADHYLVSLLIRMIEVFFGIHYRHAEFIGLAEDDYYGHLKDDCIQVHIGRNDFAELSEITKLQSPEWPIPPEIVKLKTEIKNRFPDAKSIAHLFLLSTTSNKEMNFRGKYKDGITQLSQQINPASRTPIIGAHQLFRYFGCLYCHLPLPQIGLYSGAIINGTRGEMAYLGIKHKDAVNDLLKIHEEIRKSAGIKCAKYQSDMKVNDERIGSDTLTLDDYFGRLHNILKHSSDWNTGIAVSIAIMRGLGLRKSNKHNNPITLLYQIGDIMTLQFSDKVVSGVSRYRHIPLPPWFIVSLSKLAEYYGHEHELHYQLNGERILHSNLPEDERKRIRKMMNYDGIYNAGRTAFYNFLRENNFGQKPRNLMMSHGPTEHQFNANFELLPYNILIRKNAAMLFPALEKTCLKELMESLVNHFEKCTNRPKNIVSGQSVDAAPEEEEEVMRDDTEQNYICSTVRPLTPSAECLMNLLKEKLDLLPVQQTPEYIILAGLLEFGIPWNHFVENQHYYNFDSLLFEKTTSTYWFKLILKDRDVGGLSHYPLLLNPQGIESRLLQAIKKRYESYKTKRIRQELNGSERQNEAVISEWCQRIVKRRLFEGTKLEQGMGVSLARRISEEFKTINDLCLHSLFDLYSSWKLQTEHNSLLRFSIHKGMLRTMNNCSLRDVISEWVGDKINITLINGDEYMGEVDRSHRGTAEYLRAVIGISIDKKAGRPRKHKYPTQEIIEFDAIKWVELFKAVDYWPGASSMRKFIKEAIEWSARQIHDTAIERNKLINDKCRHLRGIVKGVLNEYESDNLRVTKEFRMMPRWRGKDVFNKYKTYLLEKSSYCGDIKLCAEFYLFGLLAYCYGLRAGEIFGLKKSDIIQIGERRFIYVEDGKTDNARRLVDERFISQNTLSEEIEWCLGQLNDDKALWHNLRMHYPFPKKSKRLETKNKEDERVLNCIIKAQSYIFAEILQDKNFTPHSFRHTQVMNALQNNITNNYEAGNYTSTLCTIIDQIGHGCPYILLYAYIGTAVVGLSKCLPDTFSSSYDEVLIRKLITQRNQIHCQDNQLFDCFIKSEHLEIYAGPSCF